MRSTAIDRRTFLALAGAAAALPSRAIAVEDEMLFLGARADGSRFEAAVIDERGRDRLVLPLEARGHSFALDPGSRRVVAFARAPGRFAVAFSTDGRGEPVAIAAAPDRHFFGHGIFTPDGRLMLATENDYAGERGVTGIYDATCGFRRIGEFDSGGVGPHEAILMADGRTLCVANGGILTHPDFERQKLNLATMAPNLSYLDIASREIVERRELAPDLHQLSIRHLASDASGAVWFGCQWEGDPAETPPLVGRHRRGRPIETFTGPSEVLRSLRNYVGSLAVDASGSIVATSSPQGGVVVFWDAVSGRYLGTRTLADGCGVAPKATGSLLATSGRGAIAELGPGVETTVRSESTDAPQWDNHLRRIG